MAVIREFILALVLAVAVASVQSITEDDYPESELPGIAVPEFNEKVASNDPPICLPQTWQGNITGQTAMSGGRGKGKLRLVKNVAVYVDQTNKKFAARGDEGGRFHNESGGIVVIFSDNKVDVYVFRSSKEQCKHISRQNATFKQQCVPVNATEQEIQLGPSQGGIDATQYSFCSRSPQDRSGLKMFASGKIVLTKTDNLPILQIDRGMFRRGGRPYSEEDFNEITFDQDDDIDKRGRRGGGGFISSYFYKSVTKTIDDPSVFKPPSYCNATAPISDLLFLQEENALNDILERFVSF